jgi:uncharacterized membrane protein required for colicin V production
MNIEWWMIDGGVCLIALIAALRGAVKGVGDTIIKILCIAGGLALGIFYSDRLSAFLMKTKLRNTIYQRFFVFIRGDEAVTADPAAAPSGDAGSSFFGSIFAPDGSTESVISKSLAGIFSDAADKAADAAADRLTQIAVGVIAFALIILAVSILSMILRWVIRQGRKNSIVIGFADRVLGLVLGSVRGLLLAWIAVALLIPVTTLVSPDNVVPMMDALQKTTVSKVLYDVNPLLYLVQHVFL